MSSNRDICKELGIAVTQENQENKKQLIQTILKGIDLNSTDDYLVRSMAYDVEVMQALLAAGANPNKVVHDYEKGAGTYPLFIAVHNNNLPAIRALVAAGANVNANPARGGTPLMESTSVEATQILLEGGADADLGSCNDITALSKAVHYKQLAIADKLLTAGADPNLGRPLGNALFNAYAAGIELLFERGGADPTPYTDNFRITRKL